MTATVPHKPQKRFDDFVVWGRYVGYVLLLSELIIINQVGNMFYMIYAGTPSTIESCNNDVFTKSLSEEERCAMYEAGNCTNLVTSTQFHSVNAEFNYLCSSMKSVKNSISLQMFGVLVGSVVFGQMSDSFGRKKSLLIALFGSLISGVVTAYTVSLTTFTAARIFTGFFTGGHIAIFNVFIVENVPKHARLWINMIITWSPNMPIIALLAYLTHSWRTFSLLLAGATIPPIIMLYFFVQESPRWLIQKGKIHEARIVMNKIFKTDGRNITDNNELEDILEYEHQFLLSQKANGKQYFYYHLFSTWGLTLITTVLSFTYFSTSVINYGILFNMEKLSGSLYLNNVYSGLMRYACNLTCGYADYKFKWVGRKLVHGVGVFFIIIALATVVAAHYFDLSVQLAPFIRLGILVSLAMTSQIYISASITSSELFPTPVRNLGFSFLSMWNRFGVVVSPFVFYLENYWIALPYVIMILCAVTDISAWSLLLPETKGKPMVEHMP